MQKAKPPADEQERKRGYASDLFQQANLLVVIRQFDQAIKAYSEIIEVIPDYADAYNNRGSAYAAEKASPNRAIADFDNRAIETQAG